MRVQRDGRRWVIRPNHDVTTIPRHRHDVRVARYLNLGHRDGVAHHHMTELATSDQHEVAHSQGDKCQTKGEGDYRSAQATPTLVPLATPRTLPDATAARSLPSSSPTSFNAASSPAFNYTWEVGGGGGGQHCIHKDASSHSPSLLEAPQTGAQPRAGE
jgi:hypothetical protein